MAKTLHVGSQGVKHHLPDRTRLKVSKKFRSERRLNDINRALRKIDTVKEVDINHKTGSILIKHAEDSRILGKIEQALNDVAAEVLVELTREPEGEDVSILAELIGNALGRANYGVSRYTGNNVDLRMLVPLAFLGLGIEKASRTPGWFDHAPAYIFFFWAYDAYIRFHLHRFEERRENGHISIN